MTTWSYLGCDVMTGQVIADLPLSGPRFTRALNGHGDLTAGLPLRGYDLARRRDLLDATDPGRRAIYVLADGQPVWGGIIWPRSGAADVTVGATEWGSYFASVVLRRDRSYTGVDQLAIARDLVATHQAEPGGNVRVAVGTETSGVARTITYLASQANVVGEQIAALGNVDNGFDWAWPAEYDGSGLLRGRLVLGYPRLGAADPVIVIDAPRDIDMSEDAAALAVTAWAFGRSTGVDVPVASSTDPGLLDAGYPLLDKVSTYPDEDDAALLQARADADQQAAGGVLATVTVTIGIGEVVGSGLGPGDLVLLRLGDSPRWPGGWEATLRVTAVEYAPQEGTASLTLAPRITYGGRIPTTADTATVLSRIQRDLRIVTTIP